MSLIRLFQRWLTKGPYKIKLSRKLLSVTDTYSGKTWEQEPIVSIKDTDGEKIITGIGSDAKMTGDTIINPFDHPRVLISDYTVGEKLIGYAFHAIAAGKWFVPSPIVVIQVVEELEGGLTTLEQRALYEMAHGAGARKVYILTSEELSDEDIQNGLYEEGVER